MASKTISSSQPASTLIDQRIADLADWRGPVLARMRALIHEAAPGVVEEWKWMGTPVWSLGGILCTGESYKAAVKLTFLKGASLPDPARLFNASLDGNARRAIDIQRRSSRSSARQWHSTPPSPPDPPPKSPPPGRRRHNTVAAAHAACAEGTLRHGHQFQ